MIKVFKWEPRLPNVGHLSMQLSDGTYISYWPEEEIRLKGKQISGTQTYQDDVASEERNPDEVLELPADIVDQQKIKSWWNKCLSNERYNFLFNNCAIVIKKALEEGGIYQTPYLSEGGFYSFSLMNTPEEVFYWAKECGKLYPQKSGGSLAEVMFKSVCDYFK